MRLTLTQEQMVADRFLRSFDIASDRLESSINGLELAESAQKSITSCISSLGLGSGNRDKMCDNQARIDKAVDDIGRYADEIAPTFIDVEGLITDVQRIDLLAGKVLRLAYIGKKTASEIAGREDINISRKQVYEILKRGLDIAFWILLNEGGEQ